MHHYGVFRRLLGCGAGEDGEMTRWGEINCPRCAELEAKLAKLRTFLDELWDSQGYDARELHDLLKELDGGKDD